MELQFDLKLSSKKYIWQNVSRINKKDTKYNKTDNLAFGLKANNESRYRKNKKRLALPVTSLVRHQGAAASNSYSGC